MKIKFPKVQCIGLGISTVFCGGTVAAQSYTDRPNYVNMLVQIPNNGLPPQYFNNVSPEGAKSDELAQISREGAKYELWAVSQVPFQAHLLETINVGVMVPEAEITIDTLDPWGMDPASSSDVFTSGNSNSQYQNPAFPSNGTLVVDGSIPKNAPTGIRRTRSDKNFKVYASVLGLLTGISDDVAKKKVNFGQSKLSYGLNGTGIGTLRNPDSFGNSERAPITQNGNYCWELSPALSGLVPPGEETFVISSLRDESITTQPVAAKVLTSEYLQIWPKPKAVISGIKPNEKFRYAIPTVTFNYDDTYPSSSTYAIIYKGPLAPQLKEDVIDSTKDVNTVNHSKDIILFSDSKMGGKITSNGFWTIEVKAVSCYGKETLAHVTFEVDRTIRVNATLATSE